jgi:hypothetical protein
MRWLHACLAACLAAAALLCGADASARTKPAKRKTTRETAVQVLGTDDHWPLAEVSGGLARTPKATSCRSWGKKGSEWSALDRLGRVVGKARVTSVSRYDVVNCDDLDLTPVSGKRGVGLFVRGPYRSLAIERWKPGPAARRSLHDLVKKRDARLPKAKSGDADAPLAERVLVFRVRGQDPIAVVGGRGLTVLRLVRGRWRVEHEIAPRDGLTWEARRFHAVAVLDLDGNGRPEIVVHSRDEDGYGDMTLTEDGAKHWRRIEPVAWSGYA